MIIEEITVTAFQQHTRIVGCEKTRSAICIDPGDDSTTIVEAIDKHEFDPQAKIIIHSADEPLYLQLPNQPAWLGIPRAQWAAMGFDYEQPPRTDEHWHDGQSYKVGELNFKVIHCPGHTPGHVVLFEPDEKKVFVGDCLFAESIGRTDLPGGSTEQLMDSLFNKILPLGDDVEVYSGHGPTTTIGYERRTNPFLTGAYSIGGSGRF